MQIEIFKFFFYFIFAKYFHEIVGALLSFSVAFEYF